VRRGRPLARRTPLRAKKQLAVDPPSRVSEDELRRMAAFKAAIGGMRCVVCGKTEREALEWSRRELGFAVGLEAHHGVRRQVLRRLHLDEWAEALATPVCQEPCHRQHTSRKRRILREELPARLTAYVQEHGLGLELEREYPR
jgi:hypothetical protein